MRRLPRRAALLGGVYVLVTAGAYVAAARPPGRRAAAYMVVHLALAALMFLAWGALRRAGRGPGVHPGGDPGTDRALAVLVACGLAARLLLVPAAPFTTTDVGRYLWDGAVALHGHDPYALAPDAPALASLRAAFPPPVDHRDVATCYPPLAVGLFAAAASAGPALARTAWKLLVAGASALTALLVWRHLRGTARAADALLVALSPVLVLEGGLAGHLDAFSTLCVAAAVVAAERKRWDGAALAGGCAAALKFIPGIVLVPLLFRAPRRVRFALVAALPLAASFGVAFALGMSPPGSLPLVAKNWSFAAPVYSALYHYLSDYDTVLRPALAAAGLLAMALVSLRRGPVERNMRDVFGVGLTVSPVLYPWYGMPLVALAALAPAAWALGFLQVLPLSYEVLDGYQATGVWHPHRWPMGLITASMVVGLATDLGWKRYHRRPPPSDPTAP